MKNDRAANVTRVVVRWRPGWHGGEAP